jgi:hypothetical protein
MAVFTPLLASIFSLLFITIDRYIAIIYPLHYDIILSPMRTKVAIAVIWIYPLLTDIIPFWWNQWEESTHECSFVALVPTAYFSVFINLPIALCLIIMIYMYGQVLKEALKQNKWIIGLEMRTDVPQIDYKPVKMILTTLGVFFICWIPVLVTSTCVLYFIPTYDIEDYALLLAFANSGMNFFIYSARSKDFRWAFKKMLCGCRTNSTISVTPCRNVQRLNNADL